MFYVHSVTYDSEGKYKLMKRQKYMKIVVEIVG